MWIWTTLIGDVIKAKVNSLTSRTWRVSRSNRHHWQWHWQLLFLPLSLSRQYSRHIIREFNASNLQRAVLMSRRVNFRFTSHIFWKVCLLLNIHTHIHSVPLFYIHVCMRTAKIMMLLILNWRTKFLFSFNQPRTKVHLPLAVLDYFYLTEVKKKNIIWKNECILTRRMNVKFFKRIFLCVVDLFIARFCPVAQLISIFI